MKGFLKSTSVHIDYCPKYGLIRVNPTGPMITWIRQSLDAGYSTRK